MTNTNFDSHSSSAVRPTLQIDWIDLHTQPGQEHSPPLFCLVVTASDEVQFLYLEYFSACTRENMFVGLAHALQAWAKAPEESAGLAIMPYSSLVLLSSLGKLCMPQKEV